MRFQLPRRFPGVTFYFLPADMMTQILNFGLPAPIDVQVEGNDVVVSQKIAEKIMAQMRQISGLADLRVQQPLDYPTLELAVDRVKAVHAGLTEQNVASGVLNALSGSFQITPMFFVNWKNGVNYNLVAQAPQYRLQSMNDLSMVIGMVPMALGLGEGGERLCRRAPAVADLPNWMPTNSLLCIWCYGVPPVTWV
jgi:multidrug efflux pump subunit AcrB